MECSLGPDLVISLLNAHHFLLGSCLNPYSNGMLTWDSEVSILMSGLKCLNPYSNGMLTWEDK